jgi:hypothetical protein
MHNCRHKVLSAGGRRRGYTAIENSNGFQIQGDTGSQCRSPSVPLTNTGSASSGPAALSSITAAPAASSVPLPPSPKAPLCCDVAVTLARLASAMEHIRVECRPPAAAVGGDIEGPPVGKPGQALSTADLYRSYDRRHCNPLCLLGLTEDSDRPQDCVVIVQAAASRRSSATSDGDASDAVPASGGRRGSWAWSLLRRRRSSSTSSRSNARSWTAQQQGGAELEVMTVIPNLCYGCSHDL